MEDITYCASEFCSDTILQYLSKFTQVLDQLGGVGVNVVEANLVSLSLLGLTKN